MFRILFLCSLPNSAHFLSICMFRSKPTDIGKRKSKIANQFCVFKNWKEPSFFVSISYNLTHFATIKFSQKKCIFVWSFIEWILILGLDFIRQWIGAQYILLVSSYKYSNLAICVSLLAIVSMMLLNWTRFEFLGFFERR